MSASPPAPAERDYARIAWTVILVAFVAFLALMIGLCYAGWRFTSFAQGEPSRPATLTAFTRGVEIFRAGLVQPELPSATTILREGDAVAVLPTVPPGIAATITLFDGSVIELWPGTRVRLEQVQTTRFSSRNQRVAVLLEGGLARFSLVPPANRQYDDVQYTVAIQRPGEALEQAELELGGVYRVRVLAADAPTISESERAALGDATETELVVEQGGALLAAGQQRQTLRAGQKARSGAAGVGQPEEAVWQMARDPQFLQYTAELYNNTTLTRTDVPRSDTWYVSGVPAPGASIDGYFYVIGGCFTAAGETQQPCQRPLNKVAQFRRDFPPNHDKGFKTAITQTIALDATPYQSLQLSFDAHISVQLLDKAGIIGEECALGAVVYFITSQGNQENHTYCFYARDEPGGKGAISNKEYISSRFIPLGDWQSIQLDLKADLPGLRRITQIEFHGNGHDYLSEVANVQLLAR